MADKLKDLVVQFLEPMLVEHFYNKMKAIFVHDLGKPNMQGMILDLDSLPQKPEGLKEAVIKWLISVNLTRIKNDEEPIVTLEVVLKCPVWKIVRPPLKRLNLTKEQMFNKPTASTKIIGKKSSMGSINKKR